MTLEEMISRWEQMRNDVERQLNLLKSVQTATNDATPEMINDLAALRDKLEALLTEYSRRYRLSATS
jgi:predicted phage gp36 major capsid-like protein